MRVLATTAAVRGGTAVLGYQVLQRSRPARVALTVLGLPLFVVGLVSGGVASAVVFAAVVMLWFEPARSWFDGRRHGSSRRRRRGRRPGGDAARRRRPPRAGRAPTAVSASRRAARSTGRRRPDPGYARRRLARLGRRRWCGRAP